MKLESCKKIAFGRCVPLEASLGATHEHQLDRNQQRVTIARSYENHPNLVPQVLNMSGTNVILQFDDDNDAVGRRVLRTDFGAGGTHAGRMSLAQNTRLPEMLIVAP